MIELPVRSLLVVVSAPSGGGKTTLCERLLAEFHQMVYSVSCTTRAPRDGEIDGTDYYFISEEEFERRVQNDEFVEHATVHGHRYGTLRRFIERGFASGRDVLMDIDVQGASQIREKLSTLPASDALRRGFVDAFIAPPSIEVLRKRLHLRGKDADAVIERRLQQAENEMRRWREYKYLIVNDRLDASYDALRSIVVAEHHRLLKNED
ncbi:MAG: guanylate kinase [Kiritimatiellae bacterium]|nr:guanylate kinase [Kiritimatiellia bacterium]MCO5061324.1 guanylate kinase [Kiritimatiellia bacterium]MCO5067599.1 guanylate kinase [Kiritimatiellia bacterium]MCO6400166.1 guanylate kinase [Verrucomicrobiota bacterium]